MEDVGIEVKAPANVLDGQHTGVITKVEYRTEPYKYTDVFVETNNTEGNVVELKYGCPTSITAETKLGKLLKRFGAELNVKEVLYPAKILTGKKVTFMTMNEVKEKGTFSRIVKDSLKPLEEVSSS